jgi:ATP phosphoribosyltransferase
MEKLVIGMPAGSLADPNRGGSLVGLLEQAGFATSGYEKGGPSVFKTVNFLYGWDGRPQEFGSQMELGELDVAIAGDDWIRERVLELSLQRGAVRIVGIACDDDSADNAVDFVRETLAKKPLLTVVSEMPYLAVDWIQGLLAKAGLGDEFNEFSVQNYKTPPKIDKGVLIYKTWGKTEAKILNGGADIGLEITQSGNAIRNYGLRIIDEIMHSETGIWINPALREHKQKAELLDMFLLNLYGAINAEDKVMLLFNVSNAEAEGVERYLSDNNLFANEPTANKGHDFTQYSIQVETDSVARPVARVRYELAKLGAKNIDTVPVLSSIPSISRVAKLD